MSCSTAFQGQHNCKIHSAVMKGADIRSPREPSPPKHRRGSTCWIRLLESLLSLHHFYIECIRCAPRYLSLRMPLLLALPAMNSALRCRAPIRLEVSQGRARTLMCVGWHLGTLIALNELPLVQVCWDAAGTESFSCPFTWVWLSKVNWAGGSSSSWFVKVQHMART